MQPAVQQSSKTLIFGSESETLEFANSVAHALSVGDVILLSGEIGAGKSVLARAIIQARMARNGQIESVPSPTYTLVQCYLVGGIDMWHADLYRIADPSEFEELGLLDAFSSAICLVEWADHLGDMAPATGLSIHLSAGGQVGVRTAILTWTDPRWDGLVGDLNAK